MPVLSFYEGISELSYLLLNAPDDYQNSKSFRFPYTYSEKLFAGSFSKEEYYNCILEQVLNEFNIKKQSIEIYAGGVITEPEFPREAVKRGILSTSMPVDHVYLSHRTFIYNNSVYTQNLPETGNVLDMEANLSLYTNVRYYETGDVLKRDSFLRELVTTSGVQFTDNSLTFTGERFSDDLIPQPLTYLLMFDIIKGPGIYHLRRDDKNLFPMSFLLRAQNIPIPSVGTLINSPGRLECLFETDIGTSQLIDLESEKMFILPLEAGAQARVLIKNSSGQTDTIIYGGSLGVIFDTRDKSKDMIYKDTLLDIIERALHKL